VNSAPFAPTRWTLVAQAQGQDPAAVAALSELCAAYYAPVVAFLRARRGDEDSARELAHEFFARVLAGGALNGANRARGRFRSYLLGAVKHFLADTHDRTVAEKRGSGVEHTSLDEAAHPPVEDERVFDRQWALTVIARALETTEAELRDAGKAVQFTVLKPWIVGGADLPPQAASAIQLGLSEGAVKVAIHRLRQRFREAIKTEIAQTVPESTDIDDELRHLLAVLLNCPR
jgi:RNA polymerase sigma-70 factor (ECF subfamily)